MSLRRENAAVLAITLSCVLGVNAFGQAQPPVAQQPAARQSAPATSLGAGTSPQQTPVAHSPLARLQDGREAGNNSQIMTTGIRNVDAPVNYPQGLASNHALIITVSEYQRSPLPGVLTDRKLGIDLARRFGVPEQNIVELSEQQVTRDGLKQAFIDMNQNIMPGDKLYVYFSGHGARFFSKATGQCTESLVMQDMHVVTNTEFANMIKPLSAKTDKTIVMLDSCHSGGVALAAGSRSLAADFRPKFSPEASSPQCALAVNLGSFSNDRGIDLQTTDHNLVILAAARKNEVAWDTSKGGALTYNFQACLGGTATDTDHSGSLSMDELATCVQARLDKSQEESARQHPTLAGNAALVPALSATTTAAAAPAPSVAPTPSIAPAPVPVASPVQAPEASPAPPFPIDTLAALNDIFSQRDDRWQVQARVGSPMLKIGSNLSLSLTSQRNGFVYLFYRGTQPDSLYLLFPNQLDSANSIAANQPLQLPRRDWSVTALGPVGTDHLLLMVSDTPRDFSALTLPAGYVSQSGPFEKIQPNPQAVAHINQAALLSAALVKPECKAGAKRDLAVARECSNVFGASMVSVEETN